MGEQVELMRSLWTQRAVTHHGEYEHVTAAGLAPLPVQRPIPVWFGVASEPAFRRAGRLADGWFPMVPPGPAARRGASGCRGRRAREAGRDPGTIGMEGRVSWSADGGVAQAVDHVGRWRDAGATHIAINTMNAGLGSVDAHLNALEAIAVELLPR